MEKRLGLAIGLSLLVMVVWSALVVKPQHIENNNVVGSRAKIETPAAAPLPAQSSISAAVQPTSGPIVDFVAPLFVVSFDEQRAAIKHVKFKEGLPYTLSLGSGFLVGDPSWVFQKSNSDAESITFTYRSASTTVIKTYSFPKAPYSIRLEVTITNESSAPLQLRLPVILTSLDIAPSNPQTRFFDAAAGTADKVAHYSIQKPKEIAGVHFIAFRDQYFCGIVQPGSGAYSGWITKVSNLNSQIGLTSDELSILPGSKIGQSFEGYLGPQNVKLISAVKPAWAAIVHYGFFDFISQILLQTLEMIQKVVHNWGVAIIILSLLIYGILFPLTMKQMKSMKDMQMVQPKVEALRAQYKDNPQRMNKEVMELYKHHKVNPFGGCLPLILQMPIFFALYQALMRAPQLRGARFLWIKDLSNPDRLFTLPTSLPVIGNEVNLLPVLMSIGMFIQQKASMASASPEQAQQQKLMLIIFPVMFCFIFYHMPAGLVMYWFINSALMLVNQLHLKKS